MSNCSLERQDAVEVNDEQSYENYKELLDSLRLEAVMNLDIQRQFILSYLVSKKVLDYEDCEQITNSGATRQQKASYFLDVIRRKGSSGIKHFIDALEFDNPALYKKFTGKTATAFMAPLIPSGRAWDCISGLPAKEYIDSDRAMLSNQLEQRTKDYHYMVMQLNRSQEEKNIVEKKLLEAQLKIDQLQQCIEQFKEFLLKSPYNDEDKISFLVKLQEKELQFYHRICECNDMIMALQSKLLAQTEEIDEKNQQCHLLKEENKSMKKSADDLKLKFNLHRKLTRKFSEQSFNITSSSSEELKEMQIQLQRSAEECGVLKEENQEFLKFSDLLNTKYKMLMKENSELKAYNKQISCAFENMNVNYEESKSQCKELEWKQKCLEEVKARLEKDIKLYQDIQVAQKIDSDRLLEEKTKLYNAMVESKQKVEEGLQKQVNINNSLEEQYRQVTNELNEVRNTLEQTVKELNETKKSLSLESENLKCFMSKSCDSKNPFEVIKEQSEPIGIISNTFEMEENMNDVLNVKNSIARKRSSKDLLDSMRRKFKSSFYKKTQRPNTPTVNSLMSFQQIQLLFPTFLKSSTSDFIQNYVSDCPSLSNANCYDEIQPNHVQIQNLYFQNAEDMSLIKAESICQEKMESISNKKYDSESDSDCILLTSTEDVDNSSSPVVFRRRALLLGEKEHSWRARRVAQFIVSY